MTKFYQIQSISKYHGKRENTGYYHFVLFHNVIRRLLSQGCEMLITSFLSFAHKLFYLFTDKNNYLSQLLFDVFKCFCCLVTNNRTHVWYTYLSLYHTTRTFNDPEEKRLFKTLREKEKMLVTSIFSFSHNVFKPIKDKNHQF